MCFLKIFIFQFVILTLTINCYKHDEHSHRKNTDPRYNHDHLANSGREQVKADMHSEHALEDLDGVINKTVDQMTYEEQMLYYFKLHDLDNDNNLDGIELMKAFVHQGEHDHESKNSKDGNIHDYSRVSDDELIRIIDDVLKQADKNNDGYVAYKEFYQGIGGDVDKKA